MSTPDERELLARDMGHEPVLIEDLHMIKTSYMRESPISSQSVAVVGFDKGFGSVHMMPAQGLEILEDRIRFGSEHEITVRIGVSEDLGRRLRSSEIRFGIWVGRGSHCEKE